MPTVIRIDGRTASDGRVASLAGATAMVLATALGAQVSVVLPFTPVPFTLQVLSVLLTGLILTPRQALAAQSAYVGAGLLGVPWFAGLSTLSAGAGLVTAGYLVGFVMAAPLIALARGRLGLLPAAVLGIVAIHAMGVAFLGLMLDLPLSSAFRLGSLPFLPFDGVKALLAVAAARALFPPREAVDP